MLATLATSRTDSDISLCNVGTHQMTIDSSKCALGFSRSVTMAADLEQFQQLLNTLLSTDNDVRTQAEVRLNP